VGLVIAAFLSCALRGAVATEGPALKPDFLKYCELKSVQRTTEWNRGFYSMRFCFVSRKPLSFIANFCHQEFPKSRPYVPFAHSDIDSYDADRGAGGMRQYCSILPASLSDPGALTEIALYEKIEPGRELPAKWNRQGIAAKPPARMRRVPFLSGVWTDGVSVTPPDVVSGSAGLAAEASPAGRRPDAYMYFSYPQGTYAEVARRTKQWAKSHGYHSPCPDLFVNEREDLWRIMLTSRLENGVEKATIRLSLRTGS